MVELKALVCTKCGAFLGEIDKGLMVCGNCGTPHAVTGLEMGMVEEKVNEGEIIATIPPSIAVGLFLRGKGYKAGNVGSDYYPARCVGNRELEEKRFLFVLLEGIVVTKISRKGVNWFKERDGVAYEAIESDYIELDFETEGKIVIKAETMPTMEKSFELAELLKKQFGFMIEVKLIGT